MFTPRFETFIQPALPRAQLWRLVLGIVLIATFYVAFIALIFGGIWLFGGEESLIFWITKLANAKTPTGTILLLASFIGLLLAPILAARLLHKRSAKSLFGPASILWRDFFRSAVLVFAIFAILIGFWSLRFDAVPNLERAVWLTFLPLALMGVFIQTLAEELVFRGYLMQQLAARFQSPVIWMVIPAIAFAAVHYDPSASGAHNLMLAGSALLFGLIAADLTRITGSIGASWGFHFANNVFALLVLSTQGTIPGLALYVTPYTVDQIGNYPLLVAQEIGAVLVIWLILRRMLTR